MGHRKAWPPAHAPPSAGRCRMPWYHHSQLRRSATLDIRARGISRRWRNQEGRARAFESSFVSLSTARFSFDPKFVVQWESQGFACRPKTSSTDGGWVIGKIHIAAYLVMTACLVTIGVIISIALVRQNCHERTNMVCRIPKLFQQKSSSFQRRAVPLGRRKTFGYVKTSFN